MIAMNVNVNAEGALDALSRSDVQCLRTNSERWEKVKLLTMWSERK